MSTIAESIQVEDDSLAFLQEIGEHEVSPSYFAWKGWLDRAIAAGLLLPFLPVIGMLILLVRWTSSGPGVFKQRRVGRNGQPYTMYKLRSMRCDAEAKTGPAWTKDCSDPRITPLGKWLRKLHLDELPQLFNVLRGEMSLVGPRPERPEFVKVLKEAIPGYERRLAVSPGITGLAQINLPPDTDLDSVRRKQMLDLQYTAQASFFLDFRILLATAMRIVGIPGAVAARAALVERNVELPNIEDTVDDSASAALADTTTLTGLVEQLRSRANQDSSNGSNHGHAYTIGHHASMVEPSEDVVKRHPK